MTAKPGILLLDKPPGLTSARAVAIVKRALGKPKVGHLGTLDPFASGVLPLCIGEGTKIAPYLNAADKSYRGTVRLGVTSDTLDATGTVVEGGAVPALDAAELDALARRLTGESMQVPPAFSAIKKGGVPMYKLARKGEAPELEARPVTIHRLSIVAIGEDRLAIEVDCSKGTYIRSLARDIGQELGCGGLLETLERTAFGSYRLDEAVALAAIEAEDGAAAAAAATIDMAAALGHLPSIAVDSHEAGELRGGRQEVLAGLAQPPNRPGERARLLDAGGGLVAVVREDAGGWRLDRVFRSADGDDCCAA